MAVGCQAAELERSRKDSGVEVRVIPGDVEVTWNDRRRCSRGRAWVSRTGVLILRESRDVTCRSTDEGTKEGR